MRTTIEVPIHIRQQLAQEAASRNLKGFSRIILEALEKYFQSKANSRDRQVRSLKGCLNSKEHAKAIKELKEGRSQWRG